MLALWQYFWDWPSEWIAPEIGTYLACGRPAAAHSPDAAIPLTVAARGSTMGHASAGAVSPATAASAAPITGWAGVASLGTTTGWRASRGALVARAAVAGLVVARASQTEAIPPRAHGSTGDETAASGKPAAASTGHPEVLEVC